MQLHLSKLKAKNLKQMNVQIKNLALLQKPTRFEHMTSLEICKSFN